MKLIRITHEVWTRNGDLYLSVTVIRRLAKHVERKTAKKKKGKRSHVPEHEPHQETRLPVVSDDALPSAWVFDDGARTVDLGGGQVMKLGRIQYGLLKYIAEGGRSTQEAWEQVWEYSSPVEWRTIRDTAIPLNEKLEQCGKVLKIEVTTREVKIFIPKNKD